MNLKNNVFQQIPGIIVVMDTQSKIMACNRYSANLLGFSDEESILGTAPHHYRCSAVNTAEEFIRQDTFVRENETGLSILDIQNYADERQRLLLTHKRPFYEKDRLTGTICHCTEIKSYILKELTEKLLKADRPFHQPNTPPQLYLRQPRSLSWSNTTPIGMFVLYP